MMNTYMNINDYDCLAQDVHFALLTASSIENALHSVLYNFFHVDLRVEKDGDILVIELNNHRYLFPASNQEGAK